MVKGSSNSRAVCYRTCRRPYTAGQVAMSRRFLVGKNPTLPTIIGDRVDSVPMQGFPAESPVLANAGS